MSISKVFYNLIGDKSTIFENVEFHDDYVIFRAHLKEHLKRCPSCRSSAVRIKETKERTFRMLNLGEKRSQVKINAHKVWCQKCNTKAWIHFPFAFGKLPMTRSFMAYTVRLTAIATLLAVAIFLGLQWRTIKNIDKTNLAKRSKQFSFKKLRYLSIDEIAIKRGHKYMTIITDISTGQIIHAVEGRSEEVLRPFLKLLAKKGKRLRAMAMDMSAAYANSVRTHLPKVSIVFDRFHVTKLLNDTIDKIRRAECAKSHENGVRVLKGQRFLLLRNFTDLADDKKSAVKKLLEINKPLGIAHSMKEQFRSFWDFGSKGEACRFLVLWVIEALESGVEQLAKAARTLLHRAEGLLSYFDHKIDNGKAEGINNKIKVLKRQAYGFHDQEYFKLRLYHLHKKEFQLVS